MVGQIPIGNRGSKESRYNMIKTCTLIAASLIIVSCAGARRNDPVKQECHRALAQAQQFKTFPVSALEDAFAQSQSYRDVNIVIGRGAIPQSAGRGTLIAEVDAPLNTVPSELRDYHITNLYCKL